MIAELAVAQVILVESELKKAAMEWRQQMQYGGSGTFPAESDDPGAFGKVISFVQGLRSVRTEQGAPALAGKVAA